MRMADLLTMPQCLVLQVRSLVAEVQHYLLQRIVHLRQLHHAATIPNMAHNT